MNGQREPIKLNVNGVDLHYLEQGKGDPVVFVHGSLSDYRTWGLQMKPFARHYRVIVYSRRYHYPNVWTGDGSDYSAVLHSEDLAALIKGLKLGRVHLVASSYGAYTALFVARRYPELVRTLVLGEPPVIPLLKEVPGGDSVAAAFKASALEPARQALERGELEQGVKIFIDGVSGKKSFDQLSPTIRAALLDNARAMKAETTAPKVYPNFSCEDARRINAPTLLVTGELSPRMFHLIADRLEQCLTKKERVMIHGASHAMHAARPQAYNEVVLSFLRKH